MMAISGFLPFAGVLFCSSLAIVALLRDRRSFVHRIFVGGMLALAFEALFAGFSIKATTYAEVVEWQRFRLLVATIVPGTWLLFSLSFARVNYPSFVAKWRWIIIATFVGPLVLATFCWQFLFIDVPALDPASRWVLGLGWAGYTFSLLWVLSAALVLMNLERTFRAATGTMRWKMKFMVLGLGSLFAVRIYTESQALLFATLNTTHESINAATLIVADLLILVSFVRSRLLNVNVYLSQTALYNSLTVLVTGVYLLTVGLLAKLVSYFGGDRILPLNAFFVFLALLALTAILISDEWRQRSKRFISRHFQRPQYDYRREWTAFTERTTSLLETKSLCDAIAKMVSETFGVACVTIWLLDDSQERFVFGGSTVFSEEQTIGLKIAGKEAINFIRIMQEKQMPVDFDEARGDWAGEFHRAHTALLHEARVRYGAPLIASRELVGVMTLDERLTQGPLSVEDSDLLKTIADQAAASLLNIRLSQRLLKAKEMEAFQTLSAFFLHDLKNLASTLSLTLQNLPVHFDDPDFRQDALRVIANSVAKVNTLCSRLSLLTKGLELQKISMDLNGFVAATLADLNGSVRATLVQDLHPVPNFNFDPEQLQKVLVNLILNASEATGPQGEICVMTEQKSGWVVVAVKDNGAGMSKEFIERSLFQPFQTTKSTGLGIGLFHSKKIVEAHHGRIEVESNLGKGSVFRVFLPTSS